MRGDLVLDAARTEAELEDVPPLNTSSDAAALAITTQTSRGSPTSVKNETRFVSAISAGINDHVSKKWLWSGDPEDTNEIQAGFVGHSHQLADAIQRAGRRRRRRYRTGGQA